MPTNLDKIVTEVSGFSRPPLDKWQPKIKGKIDILIKADGSWWHEGGEIKRHSLVKLFASILVLEDQQYFLKTPVEQLAIEVEDAPFLVTSWQQKNGQILFTTNVGEIITLSEERPLLLKEQAEQTLPYLQLGRGFIAKLHRNVFYQLVEIAEQITTDGRDALQLKSGDYSALLGYID